MSKSVGVLIHNSLYLVKHTQKTTEMQLKLVTVNLNLAIYSHMSLKIYENPLELITPFEIFLLYLLSAISLGLALCKS